MNFTKTNQIYLENFTYWQVFENMILSAWWVLSGLYEWALHIIDVIQISMLINYYWYLCSGKNTVTMNVWIVSTSDLFYGPSKTIRTTKHNKFSWKHKQQILTDVFRQKKIGGFYFKRAIGEYGEYYHQLVDGNSRMLTLYEFFNNQITWNGKRFSQLSREDRIVFRNYKIEIEFV
jgi:hypothetical protein